MAGAYEHIQVIANGLIYEGWESISVMNTMHAPYVEAILTTTEKGGIKDKLNPAFTEWHFPPGTPVQIMASGSPVLLGVVDIYEPQVDAETHSITLNIKSPAKVLPLTSVNHPTGTFEDMTDIAIAQAILGPIGLPVPLKVLAVPMLVPYWMIRSGASNYQEIMRVFQQRGKMLWSSIPDGALNVSDGETSSGQVTDGAIVQGLNVVKMSARLADLQATIIEVQGQAPNGDENVLPIFGIATNPYFGPFQMLYKRVIDQAASTYQLAQIRANYYARRMGGDRLQAQFTIPCWRTGGINGSGPFWEVNWDVHCFAPYLKIDCNLRIVKVILSQDNTSATTATVFVADASAVGGSPSECTDNHILEEYFRPDHEEWPR